MARLIMVIDDTQEILDVCEEILTDAGYRVSLHAYSARNLDDIKRARPDVIICDHPPVNQRQGWQFLQRLKADQETAAIPLIICTTSTTLVRENEGWLRAKDVRVVHKPFDIADLLQAVALPIKSPTADTAISPAASPSI
jgi:CheY-like chemotaxis protein